jgi:hypothetical protein
MESQNQITDLEKHLYNKHLAVSRSEKSKPFKVKKDFSNIVETDKQKFLKRISTLFKKHPEIDPDLFFRAPYKLYPDVEYFGLDYFSTMRAIKSYTMYKKQMFLQDPDSQVESVKDSLKFIANFCIENNIQFYQYPYHRTSDLFTWMQHYKQNKINIYSVMEFTNVFSSAQSLAEDVRKIFVGEFVERFQQLYINYNNSTNLKSYIKKALPVLSNFVEKQLTQLKNNLL